MNVCLNDFMNEGGHITSNVVLAMTTHLIVPSPLEVTSKGLLALIYGIPIVTPSWITEIENRKVFSEPLPEVYRYIQIIEFFD
jgi:hypothetical protein